MSFDIGMIIFIRLKIGTRDLLSINFDKTNNGELIIWLVSCGYALKQEKTKYSQYIDF